VRRLRSSQLGMKRRLAPGSAAGREPTAKGVKAHIDLFNINDVDFGYKDLAKLLAYSHNAKRAEFHLPRVVHSMDLIQDLNVLCGEIVDKFKRDKDGTISGISSAHNQCISCLLRLMVNLTFLFDWTQFPEHSALSGLFLGHRAFMHRLVNICVVWQLELQEDEYLTQGAATLTNMISMMHNFVSYEFTQEDKPFCLELVSHPDMLQFFDRQVDEIILGRGGDVGLRQELQLVTFKFWNAIIDWKLLGEERFKEIRSIFTNHERIKELLEWVLKRVDRCDEDALYFITLLFDDEDFVLQFVKRPLDFKKKVMEAVFSRISSVLSSLDFSTYPCSQMVEVLVFLALKQTSRVVLMQEFKKPFMELLGLFVAQFSRISDRAGESESDGSAVASTFLAHFYRLYAALDDESDQFCSLLVTHFHGSRGMTKLGSHIRMFGALKSSAEDDLIGDEDEQRFTKFSSKLLKRVNEKDPYFAAHRPNEKVHTSTSRSSSAKDPDSASPSEPLSARALGARAGRHHRRAAVQTKETASVLGVAQAMDTDEEGHPGTALSEREAVAEGRSSSKPLSSQCESGASAAGGVSGSSCARETPNNAGKTSASEEPTAHIDVADEHGQHSRTGGGTPRIGDKKGRTVDASQGGSVFVDYSLDAPKRVTMHAEALMAEALKDSASHVNVSKTPGGKRKKKGAKDAISVEMLENYLEGEVDVSPDGTVKAKKNTRGNSDGIPDRKMAGGEVAERDEQDARDSSEGKKEALPRGGEGLGSCAESKQEAGGSGRVDAGEDCGVEGANGRTEDTSIFMDKSPADHSVSDSMTAKIPSADEIEVGQFGGGSERQSVEKAGCSDHEKDANGSGLPCTSQGATEFATPRDAMLQEDTAMENAVEVSRGEEQATDEMDVDEAHDPNDHPAAAGKQDEEVVEQSEVAMSRDDGADDAGEEKLLRLQREAEDALLLLHSEDSLSNLADINAKGDGGSEGSVETGPHAPDEVQSEVVEQESHRGLQEQEQSFVDLDNSNTASRDRDSSSDRSEREESCSPAPHIELWDVGTEGSEDESACGGGVSEDDDGEEDRARLGCAGSSESGEGSKRMDVKSHKFASRHLDMESGDEGAHNEEHESVSLQEEESVPVLQGMEKDSVESVPLLQGVEQDSVDALARLWNSVNGSDAANLEPRPDEPPVDSLQLREACLTVEAPVELGGGDSKSSSRDHTRVHTPGEDGGLCHEAAAQPQNFAQNRRVPSDDSIRHVSKASSPVPLQKHASKASLPPPLRQHARSARRSATALAEDNEGEDSDTSSSSLSPEFIDPSDYDHDVTKLNVDRFFEEPGRHRNKNQGQAGKGKGRSGKAGNKPFKTATKATKHYESPFTPQAEAEICKALGVTPLVSAGGGAAEAQDWPDLEDGVAETVLSLANLVHGTLGEDQAKTYQSAQQPGILVEARQSKSGAEPEKPSDMAERMQLVSLVEPESSASLAVPRKSASLSHRVAELKQPGSMAEFRASPAQQLSSSAPVDAGPLSGYGGPKDVSGSGRGLGAPQERAQTSWSGKALPPMGGSRYMYTQPVPMADGGAHAAGKGRGQQSGARMLAYPHGMGFVGRVGEGVIRAPQLMHLPAGWMDQWMSFGVGNMQFRGHMRVLPEHVGGGGGLNGAEYDPARGAGRTARNFFEGHRSSAGSFTTVSGGSEAHASPPLWFAGGNGGGALAQDGCQQAMTSASRRGNESPKQGFVTFAEARRRREADMNEPLGSKRPLPGSWGGAGPSANGQGMYKRRTTVARSQDGSRADGTNTMITEIVSNGSVQVSARNYVHLKDRSWDRASTRHVFLARTIDTTERRPPFTGALAGRR